MTVSRTEKRKGKMNAPMLVLNVPNNAREVQRILKDRSLTRDLKKAALNALAKNVTMSVSNCSFVVE